MPVDIMIDECGMYFCTMMSEDHICDHTMELLLYFGISLLCYYYC